jgi:tRNA-Thr(GGU) m(6)t(6)A37 methyltransferase TsaA
MDGPAKSFSFRPIGYIRTPYLEAAGTPIQGAACETEGSVELLSGFEAGLEGIEGFSHLILLYVFDRSAAEVPLRQKPYLGNEERGVFAIRSPLRPNPIGLTVVRLLARQGASLRVRGVDMLDGTPLLDIKPFVARIDAPAETTSRADGRFSGGRRK